MSTEPLPPIFGWVLLGAGVATFIRILQSRTPADPRLPSTLLMPIVLILVGIVMGPGASWPGEITALMWVAAFVCLMAAFRDRLRRSRIARQP